MKQAWDKTSTYVHRLIFFITLRAHMRSRLISKWFYMYMATSLIMRWNKTEWIIMHGILPYPDFQPSLILCQLPYLQEYKSQLQHQFFTFILGGATYIPNAPLFLALVSSPDAHSFPLIGECEWERASVWGQETLVGGVTSGARGILQLSKVRCPKSGKEP